MQRILQLAKVLRRCNSGSIDGAKSSGSSFLIAMTILGSVLLAFAGTRLDTLGLFLGSPASFIGTLFLSAAISSIVFSFAGVLNYMYMSDDLQDLLTLPYDPVQIICAKLLLACRTAICVSFVLTIPAAFAYGITAGMGASFFLAAVLAFVCIPLFIVSVIGALLVLAMTFVKGLRNRNTIKIIGGILGFILLMVFYVYVSMQPQGTSASGFFDIMGAAAAVLPFLGAFGQLMEGFSALALVKVLAFTVAAVVIFLLLVSKLYLDSALAMQELSSGSATLSGDRLAQACRRRSVLRTFMAADYRHVSRNPAYLVGGFLQPILFPIIVVAVFSFGVGSVESLSLAGGASAAQAAAWCVGMTLIVTITASSSGYIALSAVSREGEDMMVFKQLPIDYKTLLQARQRLALAIAALGSTTYVVLGGSLLVVLGRIPVWCVPLALAYNLLLLLWTTNDVVYRDVKKPNLVWENEADMLKHRMSGMTLVIFFLTFLAAVIVAMVVAAFPDSALVSLPVIGAVLVAGAAVSTHRLFGKGVGLMRKY